MAALFWLGVGAISFVALYMVAEEMVRDAVDNALYTAQPTPADSDAAWDREIDEAIALTVPLHESETAQRIAAVIAYNEAARADWSQVERWSS